MSIVEKKIKDKNYIYEKPWFYRNKLSLICDFNLGKVNQSNKDTIDRCFEIYDVLFEKSKPDCLFFHRYEYKHYLFDHPNLLKYTSSSFKINIKELLK